MIWNKELFIFIFYFRHLPFFPLTLRYKLIKEVGDGTFGSVWRAINKKTGEVEGG